VRFHRGKHLRRRRSQHTLQGSEIGNVRCDCDLVTPVVGNVIGHVAAGTRFDCSSAFRLTLQPTINVFDGMGDDDSRHVTPFVRQVAVWVGQPYYESGRWGSNPRHLAWEAAASFPVLAHHYSKVASPFVVFERDEVSSVAGSLLLLEASETATAGAKRPTS